VGRSPGVSQPQQGRGREVRSGRGRAFVARLRGRIALLLVGLAAVGGYYCHNSSSSAPRAVAPPALPGQPLVSVSASGDDGACSRGAAARPCASLLRAYQVARCGDTVVIENGTYTDASALDLGHVNQGVQNTDAKNCGAVGQPITFRGQSRAGVVLTAPLEIGEPWVTVSNFTSQSVVDFRGWDSSTTGCYATPVTNVAVDGAVFDEQYASVNPMSMENVAYATISNTTFEDVTTGETEIQNGGACPTTNNHVTLTGNLFANFLNPTGAAAHMECLQLNDGASGTSQSFVTITSNRFQNCGQYDVFIGGSALHDFRIVDNWFDDPCSDQLNTPCKALANLAIGPTQGASTYSRIVVEFNSFPPHDYVQFGVNTAAAMDGNVYAYNINPSMALDATQCGAQQHFVHVRNFTRGAATCPGDVRARIRYVSPGPPDYDLDLASGSAGLGALAHCPVQAPSLDIHGTQLVETKRTSCNVGASQANAPGPDAALGAAGHGKPSGAAGKGVVGRHR